jgi:O-antigen biosynthesis protein
MIRSRILRYLSKPKSPFPQIDFALDVPLGSFRSFDPIPAGGSIAFVIPPLERFSGGHTSVLRLGTWLHRFGYAVTYIAYGDDPTEDLRTTATALLPEWQGTLVNWPTFVSEHNVFDVGIATYWVSAYYVMKYRQRFSRGAYFIQDYEPDFYPMGDLRLLTEQTYRFGLRHISLGPWNIARIRRLLDVDGGYIINFPVELQQFPIIRRPLQHDRGLRIATYMKEDPKRAPALLAAMLEALAIHFRSRGIEADIRVFGLDDRRGFLKDCRNLGKLATDDLKRLYAWADFGVVGSLTNISLINYEMLACGLPVVDLAAGSAPSFFEPDEMLFAATHQNGLVDQIEAYWGRTTDLEKVVERAQAKIVTSRWSWEQSSRQFEAALRQE